ncbi:hypothetical protein [Novosphingobium sp. 9U]|uniref:DUF7065 domain-containing protein n=1 Tax=Novosphingobium sp. 9U TaxID=2653158 RepID=UPI00135A4F44|nr:hypothetical protein [Novosphingobium sp. 9U]
MHFIDGSAVHVYPPQDERPHPPGPDESWQESFVIYWYDPETRVGGGFRLGTEPNHEGGRSQFLIMLLTPEGAYRRITCVPSQPGDVSADGVASGDGTLRYRFDGERIYWTLQEAGVAVSLTVELTVPPVNAHRRAGIGSAEAVMSAHVDAACKVTGSVMLEGRAYAVDGFGIRDHAWGNRDLSTLRSHRWLIADMGDGDTFVAMTFLSADDTLAKFGWMIRGNTVHLASHVATRAHVDDDGATAWGGTLAMTLDTGESIEARFDPVYRPFGLGWTFIHPTFYTDAYCRVTIGERTGFGIFEASANIRGGTLIPATTDGAIVRDGFHPDVRPL